MGKEIAKKKGFDVSHLTGTCEICGKPKSLKTHQRCSRIKQKQFMVTGKAQNGKTA